MHKHKDIEDDIVDSYVYGAKQQKSVQGFGEGYTKHQQQKRNDANAKRGELDMRPESGSPKDSGEQKIGNAVSENERAEREYRCPAGHSPLPPKQCAY
ncbi:hypothetical protein FACS1894105_06310 [Clostridia bacterium]|nr:hypothetical protein FACS1894105_06310 [Clostridia bacterium]